MKLFKQIINIIKQFEKERKLYLEMLDRQIRLLNKMEDLVKNK